MKPFRNPASSRPGGAVLVLPLPLVLELELELDGRCWCRALMKGAAVCEGLGGVLLGSLIDDERPNEKSRENEKPWDPEFSISGGSKL